MASDLQRVLQLEVPIIVRLGHKQISVSEVLGIRPGAIIELPKLAEDQLDLMVNNKVIGLGEAVKVGENFGIRVGHIGDVRERIEALGAGEGIAPSAGGSDDSGMDDDDAEALAAAMLAGQV
ncbi:MAG: FliM/FliN family flagellar motor switch protein [Planctomycetota bacterium]